MPCPIKIFLSFGSSKVQDVCHLEQGATPPPQQQHLFWCESLGSTPLILSRNFMSRPSRSSSLFLKMTSETGENVKALHKCLVVFGRNFLTLQWQRNLEADRRQQVSLDYSSPQVNRTKRPYMGAISLHFLLKDHCEITNTTSLETPLI